MTAVGAAVKHALYVVCPVCLGDRVVACDERFDTVHVRWRSCPGCVGSGSRGAFDFVRQRRLKKAA